jgi:Fe-S-cluster containining protein
MTGQGRRGDRFECQRCGNCCRVEGYVRLAAGEVDTISRHLGLDIGEFTRQFTRLTADRRCLSLTEQGNGACVFLQRGGGCRVQAVKPEQCRGFPVTWSFLGYEKVCRAMGAGQPAGEDSKGI